MFIEDNLELVLYAMSGRLAFEVFIVANLKNSLKFSLIVVIKELFRLVLLKQGRNKEIQNHTPPSGLKNEEAFCDPRQLTYIFLLDKIKYYGRLFLLHAMEAKIIISIMDTGAVCWKLAVCWVEGYCHIMGSKLGYTTKSKASSPMAPCVAWRAPIFSMHMVAGSRPMLVIV